MDIPFHRYWDLLAPYIKIQKARFFWLTILLLGSIGLQVINPQIMRYFIDVATTSSDSENLSIAAIAFIVIALIQQVVGVSATYLGENVAWTATNALRSDLARHCLALDMSFHNNTSPGELIERIDGDVTELSNFFSQMVIRVLGNVLLMAGILVAMFFEDWRVGGIFTVFAVVTLTVLNLVRGIAIPHQKKMRAAIAEFFGFLEERLSGTEDIRSSGAVDYVMLGLYKHMFRIGKHWQDAWRRFVIVRFAAGMLLTLGISLSFISGYNLFQAGLISLGTVYLIVYYTNLLRRPIREITHQIENLQNIGAATERLRDLQAIEGLISDGPGREITQGALALQFEGVHFSYIDDEPVLNGISFQLKPGAVLGLLGRTGSGKTTLARLVFRLYDPTQGGIMLGGVPLPTPHVRALRDRVAIVTQDVQLFQATVRDNLTFFDRSIPDERIMDVIAELGLMDWYQTLSHGLKTKLESGGRGLSAGEGQLLAFTRVFLRDPGLVILDEASSRLDPATEQLIERAVDKLLQDRTAIIIAHRLGTIQRTDEIMILDNGHIVEHGHRDHLAGDPHSRFYGLLQTGLEEVLV
ncbi:MAG: ABC transporter ATP-binding protein [Chloroflexi bacterium]|nr:ABC transporter ATP-binding protein [Chloroflexota bacterium]